MVERKWEPDILNALIVATGKTYDQVAHDTGIGKSTLNKILHRTYPPSADILMSLAEYLGVTMDFLCGRYEDDDADVLGEVWTEYPKYFNCRLRCSYEKSIETRPRRIQAGYLAVWPYNLLDDIFLEPVSFIMDEDHMKGLEAAFDTLNEREREWTLLVYRDGLTLTAAGEKVGRTKDRVAQVTHKAIRKLRHPSRTRLILDGLEGSKQIDEERDRISQAKRKLLQERAELEAMKLQPIEEPKKDPYLEPIETFLPDLTVRSRNCLYRADIATLRDLLNKCEDGSLRKVRNLGFKSIEEILGKLYWIGVITIDDVIRYCQLNGYGLLANDFAEELYKMRKDATAS